MRNRLSYANVVATLALVVAVMGTGGGVAYAHGKIGTSDLRNGAVTTPKLASGAVGTGKIKSGAVKRGKIADGAVNRPKIANGAINDPKLAPKVRDGVIIASVKSAHTSVVGWHNRYGGAPTVTTLGTGHYRIVFPGTSPSNGSIVQVTSEDFGVLCSAWHANVGGQPGFRVSCLAAGPNTAVNSSFSFSYIN